MNGSINGFWTMLAIMVIFVLAFAVSRVAWRFYLKIYRRKQIERAVKKVIGK